MSRLSKPGINVRFEIDNEYALTMRVGLSDTILDIKIKLCKPTGIPVCHQLLSYESIVIEDNETIQSCLIVPNSIIQVLTFDPYRGDTPDKVQPLIRLLDQSQASPLFVPVNLSDSVLQLKHTIVETNPGLPVDRLRLYRYKKIKLEDDKCLADYFLLDGSEIDVFIEPPQPPSATLPSKNKPPLPPSPSKNKPPLVLSSSSPSKTKPLLFLSSSPRSNRMMIKVLTCSKMRLHLEVNAADKVQVLKNELKKLQAMAKFEPSADGYIFIHKDRVLEEGESFLRNNIRHGDEIEICNVIAATETASISSTK